ECARLGRRRHLTKGVRLPMYSLLDTRLYSEKALCYGLSSRLPGRGGFMGLNLPQQPERLYETNPLKLVLAQLRFPPLLAFEATATLAPFQRALADEYPMLQEEQQVAFAINADGIAATPQNKVWRFRTIDGGRSIVLA